MPRDGSGVYSLPNAQFTPATTIASAAVNGDLADMVNDMNSARPITAGGTGQTTPIGAHDAFVAAGTPVASASTVAIDAVTGPLIDLTGNVTVTAVTLGAGKLRIVRATGTPLLTASSTLVVNGSTSLNYQCIAGDLLVFQGYAGSIVDVWSISQPPVAITAVASAATTNIGASPTQTVSITGGVNITAFDTVRAGTIREGTFAGALLLTYDPTKLITPGAESINTAAGDAFRAVSLGSGNWRITRYTRSGVQPLKAGAGYAGGFRNLKITVTGNTTFTITADGLTLYDANGNPVYLSGVSLTNTNTGVGAGGISTGTVATSTWYNGWVLYNPTTQTVTSVIDLSASSPTLPSGYTYMLRVGAVRNAASGGYWRTIQYGRRTTIAIGTNPTTTPVIASGIAGNSATPTWVAESISAIVPSTASAIHVTASCGGSQIAMVAPNNSYGASGTTTNPAPININNGSTAIIFSISDWITVESSNVYYIGNNAASAAVCTGWEDNL